MLTSDQGMDPNWWFAPACRSNPQDFSAIPIPKKRRNSTDICAICGMCCG